MWATALIPIRRAGTVSREMNRRETSREMNRRQ
jgi:hypothetical protein